MSNRKSNSGFTLVEMLVASAIVVAIVSMVYGSYAATTRSIDLCDTRMQHSARAHLVLRLMARQIRCAYVPRSDMASAASADSIPGQSSTTGNRLSHIVPIRQDESCPRFRGDPHDLRGEILSFVTTSGFALGPDSPCGFSYVAYRYDRTSSTLYIGRQVCVDPLSHRRGPGHVQPVLNHVTSIDLRFHDGRQWHNKWNYDDRKMMPKAIKIELVVTDESGRQLRYRTTTPIICQTDAEGNTVERTLTAEQP